MQFFAMTDKGKIRPDNEDYIFASDTSEGRLPNLFLVADGMGGHKAGEYASSLAVTTMLKSIRASKLDDYSDILKAAIFDANSAVFSCAQNDEKKAGMGTTVVAATIGDKIQIANIGDSRAYVIKDGALSQVTRDHTMIEEMLRNGTLSKQAAKHHPNRHVITRAIGVESEPNPDFFSLDKEDADQILLCTDGLTNMVDNSEIEKILLRDTDVAERVTSLMEEANTNGGVDNITLLLIDLSR